jgi:hypothetical protein
MLQHCCSSGKSALTPAMPCRPGGQQVMWLWTAHLAQSPSGNARAELGQRLDQTQVAIGMRELVVAAVARGALRRRQCQLKAQSGGVEGREGWRSYDAGTWGAHHKETKAVPGKFECNSCILFLTQTLTAFWWQLSRSWPLCSDAWHTEGSETGAGGCTWLLRTAASPAIAAHKSLEMPRLPSP